MKKRLEKEVCSFYYAVIFHKYGLKPKDILYYWKSKEKYWRFDKEKWISTEKDGYFRHRYPAWTIKDLNEVIPEYLGNKKLDNVLYWYKKDNYYYCEFFDNSQELVILEGKTEIELKTIVLNHLLKNGHLKVENDVVKQIEIADLEIEMEKLK